MLRLSAGPRRAAGTGPTALRKRVARLIRQAGLQGWAAKRWKKTTIPDPAAAARADRIRRDFTADAPEAEHPLVRRHYLFGSGRGYVLSGWRPSSAWVDGGRVTAHNQRPCRNARSWSPGWKRSGAGPGLVSRRSTASLAARSASRY